MSPLSVDQVITVTFLLLGTGFLVANGRLGLEYAKYLRRRRGALLTWRSPKPPDYAFQLAIGVALGLILFYNVYHLYRLYHGVTLDRRIFGQSMMFLVLHVPLSSELHHRARVLRGRHLGGQPVHPIQGNRRDQVAGGEAGRGARHHLAPAQSCTPSQRARPALRRSPPALRDKIPKHDIHFSGTGLDLLDHDEREDI